MKKNYGIMKYTRKHKNPSAKASAQYLADMFDLYDTARIESIYDVKIKDCKEYVPSDYDKNSDLGAIRGIFLEKQLKKHGRDRLTTETIIDDYKSDDIAGITQEYLAQKDKLRKDSRETRQKYDEVPLGDTNASALAAAYAKACRAETKYDQQCVNISDAYGKIFKPTTTHKKAPKAPAAPKNMVEKIRPVAKQARLDDVNTSLAYSINRNINDNYTQQTYATMKNQEMNNDTSTELWNGVSTEKTMAKLERGTVGEYKNIPLAKKLQEILDKIIGQSEIRAQERGFNRPSRFSHFVKNCFLPVYRCNKPRKRPAFYVDASGSMGGRTVAIGAFLRANHRRISELRPKYYAFASADYALEFDVKKELPRACGGTSVGFIANIKEKENNVVITDAEFTYSDLALIRMWAIDHPKAQVNWIINNVSGLDGLKTALIGLNNHAIHYINF